MAATILAGAVPRSSPTSPRSPTSPAWPTCSRPWASPSAATGDRLEIDRPAEHRPRGALRAGRAHAGLDRGARPPPGPRGPGQGGAARAATTSATARSTCTCGPSSSWAQSSTSAHGFIEASGRTAARRARCLEFPSVGATENALMAAVLAEGDHGHRERGPRARARRPGRLPQPHGRQHPRGGSSRPSPSRASRRSTPVEHEVIPDRIEAATFLAAVAWPAARSCSSAPGPSTWTCSSPSWARWACASRPTSDGIWAMARRRPVADRRVDAALPAAWPPTTSRCWWRCCAWPTGPASSPRTSSGAASATSTSWCAWGPTSASRATTPIVRGREQLSGAPVRAHDIRAGAALVVAALRAEG